MTYWALSTNILSVCLPLMQVKGEFYTPHEVSLLMSEIIADHLKDREEISIYDPTSGSGSLLINIGHSVAKHLKSADNIKYYAQELIENTFNLTRMNLVMRAFCRAIFSPAMPTLWKTTGRWKASRFIWMPWCPIRLIPSRGIQKTKKTTYVTNALASPRKQEPILPFYCTTCST